MFPALVLFERGHASGVSRFRLKTKPEAEKRFAEWTKAGRPTGPKDGLGVSSRTGQRGLLVAWETLPDGSEGATGDMVYAHHVTGSAALAMATASALGLVSSSDAKEYLDGAREFFANRQTGCHILNIRSVDEAVSVDDDLYSASLARWIDRATGNPPTAALARDAITYLSYAGDPLLTYHQHSALLGLWPVQDPDLESDATKMLARFKAKATPNGPAMSLSIEALLEARYGDAEKALAIWERSWSTYSDDEGRTFRETPRSREEGNFVTGAAGCWNAVLYGLVGFRIDFQRPKMSNWQVPLRNGAWLSLSPNLPKSWGKVSVGPVKVLGETYNFELEGRSVRLIFPAR